MEEEDATLGLAYETINRKNFHEILYNTFGVAVLSNGHNLKVLYHFEALNEVWKLYNEALVMADPSAITKVLVDNTRGGIFDTGHMLIDIQNIVALYPIYRHKNDDEETQEATIYKMRAINDFLYGEMEE